jgi:hypothetical protein
VAAIWFEIVDGYIQRRGDQADDDIIKGKIKQAAAPKSPSAPLFSYILVWWLRSVKPERKI